MTTTGAFAPATGKPPVVRLEEEPFVVVSTTSLAQRADIIGTVGRGEAKLALAAYLEAHPNEKGALQVVPLHEVS